MDWPKSTGKGVEAYVADEPSRLDPVRFEEDIRKYIGSELSSKLLPAHFQMLFEISDDYVRRYTALSGMKNKNKFLKDCKSRTALVAATRKWLVDFQEDLNSRTRDESRPLTALLAQSVSQRVSKLKRVLEKEFGAVEYHQRLAKTMVRMQPLKYMRSSYVAHLNFYIEDVALPNLPRKSKEATTEKIIAGVMSAAGAFSAREKAKGLEQCVHMARWRAKAFIKSEFYDQGEFPVFESEPGKKIAL
jgi:hypothetical protein